MTKSPLLKTLTLTALFAGSPFLSTPSADAREWTATDGRSLEATFVSLEGENLTLKLTNGNDVAFTLDKLKPADRDAAKRFATGIGDDTFTKKAAKHLDTLLATNLAKNGFSSFNEPLPDDLFARRVYLDILGRIPTREEFVKFADNPRAEKREELIDELLMHPGYAHHMFNYFADMYRLTGDVLPNMRRGEPYIHWWYEQLQKNTPYDEIVTAMITASGNQGHNPASGFLLRDAGMEFDAFANFSQIMLGIDISCAQCHDHPFTEWEQIDFYKMAAFFGNTQRSVGYRRPAGAMMMASRTTMPGAPEGWTEEFIAFGESKGVRYEGQNIDRSFRYYINALGWNVTDNEALETQLPHDFRGKSGGDPGDVVKPSVLIGQDAKKGGMTRREALANWLIDAENPRFSMVIANRMWKRAFGRALIEPMNDFEDLSMSGQPQALEFAAKIMRGKDIDYDLKQFMRVIYNTKAYQSYATADEPDLADTYYFQGPVLRRMRAEQAWDSLMLLSEGAEIDTVEGRDGSFYTEIMNVDFENDSMEQVFEKFQAWKSYARNGDAKVSEPGQLTPETDRHDLIRASQMAQPSQPASLLDTFGQSDREITDDHNFDGSVPQVLALMNGDITDRLTGGGAKIVSDLEDLDGPDEKVRGAYFTMLSRYPTDEELATGMEIIKDYGDQGIRDLAWALMNSPEFLFVQ